ncbi:hypothetical protein FQR65_LT09976 [Abscondita terminalis]|nr:hypothetical protein FQR65_LT09976 [Abscondita terminalis]
MNAVLVITFALFGVSHQLNFQKIVTDFEDAIKEEVKDCYAEFKLDRNTINAKLLELPNDRDFKCFFNCVFTHLNIFDQNGNIVEDKLRKYLDVDQELEDKIYNNCKDIQGADGCEKFFNMVVCARKYLL